MPRGVALPEPRQQLFAALERVIAVVGPSRLTGRAVTREAGVATGLLYAHFANFDDFLVGYAVDRSFQISGQMARLPDRAGTGTVSGNLSDAILATPLEGLLVLTRVVAVRPELALGVEAVLGSGTAGLRPVEQVTARYLIAEQQLGRVPADADTEALALAVVGVLHYIALTSEDRAPAETLLRRAVAALTADFRARRRSADLSNGFDVI